MSWGWGEMLAHVACLKSIWPKEASDCPILWGSQLPGLWGVSLSWEEMMCFMSQNVIQAQGTKGPRLNAASRGLIRILWPRGVWETGPGWKRKAGLWGVCLVPWTVL